MYLKWGKFWDVGKAVVSEMRKRLGCAVKSLNYDTA